MAKISSALDICITTRIACSKEQTRDLKLSDAPLETDNKKLIEAVLSGDA